MSTAYADENNTTRIQQEVEQQHAQELAEAVAIKESYALFIDTIPSDKKKVLALQTKQKIEHFQASYPDATFKQSMFELLYELNQCLQNGTKH